jgi:hypothetical protein
MKHFVFPILLVFLVFFTACNKIPGQTINPEVLVSPTPPPQPETGKATMTGRVMHQDGYPIKNVIVRLAEVARGAEGRGGAFILDLARSPGTVTDQNGFFAIQNIKPGEYVIVIGDVETTSVYQIIKETNGSAKIWSFPADKVTDIGVLTVTITIPTPFPTLPPGVYPAPTSYPSP